LRIGREAAIRTLLAKADNINTQEDDLDWMIRQEL
jgi:hypothetical protein